MPATMSFLNLLQTIDGYLFPKYGFFENIVRSALNFKPDDDDIILATYPKCGTTWTQYIIWEILNDGARPPSLNEMMFQFCPFLEMTGAEAVQKLENRPRVMKVHTPYGMTPRNASAKYIFVLRNPFDTCVSYYHHMKEIDFRLANAEVTFDEFFDHFVRGSVPFGDFFEHTASWYEHRNDRNVLFCVFEDMKADHRKAVLRIAEFINPDLRTQLDRNEEVMAKILHYSGFEYMKENLEFKVARGEDVLTDDYRENMKEASDHQRFRTVDFFRKGVVGGWREVMSDEQKTRMERVISEKIRDSTLKDLLKPGFADV